MATQRCLHCDNVLVESELASGWCDSCGKRIPGSSACFVDGSKTTGSDAKPAPATGFKARLLRFLDGRSRIVLILIGIGVFYWGYEEYQVSQGTRDQPAEVDLAALERGQPIPQNHVRIGRHVRLYFSTVYAVNMRDKDKPDAPVDYSFYPIVSPTNNWIVSLNAALQDGQADKKQPEAFPRLDNLKILVKTKQFRRVSDIPKGIAVAESVTGLVINKISKLSQDESKLIHEEYPDAKLDDVLILEEGRTPTTSTHALIFMAVGVGLIGLAIVTFFLSRAAAQRSSVT